MTRRREHAGNISTASIPRSEQDVRASVELTARRRIDPLQQGQLDKLCGLYSAINAIRLAAFGHSPVNISRSRELFEAGIEFLWKRKGLVEAATSGISNRNWRGLVRHVVECAAQDDVEFVVEYPEHIHWQYIDEAYAWMEESIRDGKPVLIPLLDGMDHFSVVAGVTHSTLQLFDSTGLRFVRKSHCDFADAYHRIAPKFLMRIAAQSKP